MVHADSSFRMGQTHEVCEDYAATGSHGDCVVAAVSDGCSSEDHTDIGARALVRAAVRILSIAPDIDREAFEKLVATDAMRSARAFDVGHKSCYATLMTITHTPERFRVMCWGDGIVGHADADGRLMMTVITWPDDQPYYPVYSLLGETEARPSLTKVTFIDGEMIVTEFGPVPEVYFDYQTSRFRATNELVFVGSDGWSSFLRKGNRDLVPIQEVLERLLPFKSAGPAFVRRRLGAFVRGLGKTDWMHTDDLSLAAISTKE